MKKKTTTRKKSKNLPNTMDAERSKAAHDESRMNMKKKQEKAALSTWVHRAHTGRTVARLLLLLLRFLLLLLLLLRTEVSRGQ